VRRAPRRGWLRSATLLRDYRRTHRARTMGGLSVADTQRDAHHYRRAAADQRILSPRRAAEHAHTRRVRGSTSTHDGNVVLGLTPLCKRLQRSSHGDELQWTVGELGLEPATPGPQTSTNLRQPRRVQKERFRGELVGITTRSRVMESAGIVSTSIGSIGRSPTSSSPRLA
jgi:hypothetical protein